jgi:hypothetical protein
MVSFPLELSLIESLIFCFTPINPMYLFVLNHFFFFTKEKKIRNAEQLLATDILVLATMKNAAKCDT